MSKVGKVFRVIVYNLLGPLSLALGVGLFYSRKVTESEINQLLRLIWLTSVSALIFTFIVLAGNRLSFPVTISTDHCMTCEALHIRAMRT